MSFSNFNGTEPAPWTISEANNHCVHAFEKLRIQREQGRFCDVTLSIQGRTFPAHRSVLASCSPWFDTRLKAYKMTRETVEVTQCKNYEIFHQLLTYCYTGQIIVDRNNVPELLHLSHYYAITKLKSYCSEYMERNLNTRNCIFVVEMALKYCLSDLVKQSFSFLERNFSSLYCRPEVLSQASSASVTAFLAEKSWSLSQELILKFIALWVNADIASRKDRFHALLDYVNWTQVDTGFLNDHLEKEPLYYHSSDSLFIILNTLDRNSIYLEPKYHDIYQNLQDQDLELDDSNSFLSLAINSAVKDLEHSDVDPDWFLQSDPANEPPYPTYGGPSRSTNGMIPTGPHSNDRPVLNHKNNNNLVAVSHPSSSAPTDFDFSNVETEYQIVEQVINEQRLSEERSKYKDINSSIKRYDPKFRALTEAFRQMEDVAASNSMNNVKNDEINPSVPPPNNPHPMNVGTKEDSIHQDINEGDHRIYNNKYSNSLNNEMNKENNIQHRTENENRCFANKYPMPQTSMESNQDGNNGKCFKYPTEIHAGKTVHTQDNRYYKYPSMTEVGKDINSTQSYVQPSLNVEQKNPPCNEASNDGNRLLIRHQPDTLVLDRDTSRYEESKEPDKFFKHPSVLLNNSKDPQGILLNRETTINQNQDDQSIYKNLAPINSVKTSTYTPGNILPSTQGIVMPDPTINISSERYIHKDESLSGPQGQLPDKFVRYHFNGKGSGNIVQPIEATQTYTDCEQPSEESSLMFLNSPEKYDRGKALNPNQVSEDVCHMVEGNENVERTQEFIKPPPPIEMAEEEECEDNNISDEDRESADYVVAMSPQSESIQNVPKIAKIKIKKISSMTTKPIKLKTKFSSAKTKAFPELESEDGKGEMEMPPPKASSQQLHVKKAKLLAEHRQSKALNDGNFGEEEPGVLKESGVPIKKAVPLKCSECPYFTPDKNRMRLHAKTHEKTKATQCQCPICEFKTKLKQELRIHIIANHIKGPPFTCDLCPYTNDRLTPVLSHRKSHSDVKSHNCTQCAHSTKTKKLLLAHVKRMHGKAEEKLPCLLCTKRFATPSGLKTHQVSHSSEQNYACDKCGFKTKYKAYLVTHSRIHSGQVLCCDQCDYFTLKRNLLEAHIRTHTGEKKFVCKECGRGFVENSQLTRHSRIHSGEKPFGCEICSFRSYRKDKLKSHIQRKHVSKA